MTEHNVVRIGSGPAPAPTAAAPATRRPSLQVLIAAGAAVLVVAAAAFFLLRGGDIDVSGTLVLRDGYTSSPQGCQGKGGYDDIHSGAQVVITDAAGTTLALGTLGTGFPASAAGCRFGFTVTSVPGGHDFYGVEVSHRGRVQYAADALADGVTVTLG